MRMILKKGKTGTMTYAVSDGYRILYALFCVFLIMGFALVVTEEGLTGSLVVPAFLFIISLIGLCYRECWAFDIEKKEVRYHIGCAVFLKKETIPFDRIGCLEITHFVRGHLDTPEKATSAIPRGRNKAMVVFSLRLVDDVKRDIEIIPEKTSGGRTENAARALAIALDIAFKADRESNMVQKMSIRDL